MSLSSEEHERYSRQLLLKEIGNTGQEQIKASRVLVVGAGGLGCPALQYLSAAGVGTLGVMDFDLVTPSNLHRQILFTTHDIGKPKAICAAEKLMQMNPLILVKAINEKLTVKNIRRIFSEFDIIVDGTDNFMTRYLINDACVLADKAYVFGSLYKFSGQVAVFNYLLSDGSRSANYRTVFPEPPVPGSVLDCSEVGVLGSVAGLVGALQATETLKLITETGDTVAGKLMVVDTLKPEFNLLELPKHKGIQTGAPQSWDALESFDYEQFCSSKQSIQQIDRMELEAILESGNPVQIVDVREEWESEEIETLPSIPISLYVLKDRLSQLDASIQTIVFCATGNRSVLAVKILEEAGFGNVVSLQGGIKAWNSYQKV